MIKKLYINENNNKRCFTKEARTSNPKFISVYVSQEYVPGYGWEDITVYDDTSDASLRNAKQDVKDYKNNGYTAKVITRKLNNPNYAEPDSTITFDDAVEWVKTCPYKVRENYAQYPNKNYTLESDNSWNTVQIFIYEGNIVKVRNCEANRTKQVYSIAELEKEVNRIFKNTTKESIKSFTRFTEEDYKNNRITYTLIGTDEDGEFVTDIDSLSEFNLTKYLCLMLKNSRVYQVGVYSSDYPNDCLDVYTRGESDPTKFNFKVK